MQVNQILQKSTRNLKNIGIPHPRFEAEILLLAAIGQSRSREWLLANHDHPLDNETVKQYNNFLKRRKKIEPIAFITNHKEFYGYDFYVDDRVLIPRPESEILVEKSVEIIKDALRVTRDSLRLLELGTGSGCIIISIIKELKKQFAIANDRELLRTNFKFIATDISQDALDIAQKNAEIHQVDQFVHFVQSDLFGQLLNPRYALRVTRYDLIIANLPYVPSYWLEKSDWAKTLYYEPNVALDGGPDGLDLYRRFFQEAPKYLTANGMILIECEDNQIERILQILKDLNYKFSHKIFRDYNNLRRVMRIQLV